MSKIYFILKPSAGFFTFEKERNIDSLIDCGEMVNKTPKGYRIKRNSYEGFHSENHYWFFASRMAALQFVAEQAKKSAEHYEQRMINASIAMAEAQNELRKEYL